VLRVALCTLFFSNAAAAFRLTLDQIPSVHDAFAAAVAAADPLGFAKTRPLWVECQHYQAAEPLAGEIDPLAHVTASYDYEKRAALRRRASLLPHAFLVFQGEFSICSDVFHLECIRFKIPAGPFAVVRMPLQKFQQRDDIPVTVRTIDVVEEILVVLVVIVQVIDQVGDCLAHCVCFLLKVISGCPSVCLVAVLKLWPTGICADRP
jgi:hypothetical protein